MASRAVWYDVLIWMWGDLGALFSISAQIKNSQTVLLHDLRDIILGADWEIWTLAPVSRPTPLAGEPLHHLGKSAKIWRTGWDSNPRYVAVSPVFKTGSLNHSDTCPCCPCEVLACALTTCIFYHIFLRLSSIFASIFLICSIFVQSA